MLKPILLAGAFAALAFPTGALAAPKDSDHDGMPNKWELRYHLNAKKSDATKDKDKDGLDNLSEYEAHTNPRKVDSDGDGTDDANEDSDDDGVENEVEEHTGSNPGSRDSDHDGTDDGHELAGTILSFDGTTLVISRVDGTQLSGTVSAETEIEGCRAAPAASAARLSDDHEGEDSRSGDGEHASGGGEHGDAKCTTAALAVGAAVHEAEVENGVFHSVHLNDD